MLVVDRHVVLDSEAELVGMERLCRVDVWDGIVTSWGRKSIRRIYLDTWATNRHERVPAEGIEPTPLPPALFDQTRCAILGQWPAHRSPSGLIDKADRDRLDAEIEAFDAAVPSVKDARDILEHFDDYARGEGKLARRAMQDLSIDAYDAAARFWGGGYDPATETITQGPFAIVVPEAIAAAARLQRAVYTAAQAIDRALPVLEQ
jgi:hypothetical protein